MGVAKREFMEWYEENEETLHEGFKEQYSKEWDKYVDDEYVNHVSGIADYHKEMNEDHEIDFELEEEED